MKIKIICDICHIEYELTVTEESVDNYRKGMLIQDAFPYLTPDERELLISGICGKCFDNLFK